MAGLLEKLFGTYSQRELKKIQPIVDKVLSYEEEFKALSDSELKMKTDEFKSRLKNGETLDDILPEAFATVREASWRVLEMRHFPVQIIGGIVLHQGRIAEMKTGEGKTLVATLPAYLNALTGEGVHIVTVNDYLARRDSEWMGKLYRFLGLSVGLAVSQMTPEEKQKAYNADITYGTNNEMGFDYLRDNMVIYKQNMVQRGHAFAIVDEVDSILIDEARTPLIISGAGEESTQLYTIADRFVRTLSSLKFKEIDSKEETDDIDADYIIDEKAKTVTLTKRGVEKAERAFNVENLSDPENMTLMHHINQAMRAHGTMHRDVNYVVKDGEVLIVDEFTGRIMIGRRYSDGLHQAIEAKENVKVERENRTLATITFQNYFRLYKKLSGMTGTAKTEEEEFRGIYSLDVIEIPTNKPLARIDENDRVYLNHRGKIKAIADEIARVHATGQPILVGTVTIDKSEELSAVLKARGIKHQVLNAKHHDKEALIVAQAGKKGAVTIATNMAGRGTDIMLGGNAEYMAKTDMAKQGYSDELISEATGFADTEDEAILEARAKYSELYAKYKSEIESEAQEVRALGGLYIMGTERHESRRIDNQLRGRSGRQGDPGNSRFFLGLDDDLMRLFGGERIERMVGALKLPEDEPIEQGILTSVIENSQKKVEGKNFSARKYVLQYDDVMNQQRNTIYADRRRVLNGEDVSDYIMMMIGEIIDGAFETYASAEYPDDWNMAELIDYLENMFFSKGTLDFESRDYNNMDKKSVRDEVYDMAMQAYESQKELFGEAFGEVQRVVLLRSVDSHWMNHIDDMDHLKEGINLRAYGQHDPVKEYTIMGFDMFNEMKARIHEDTVRNLFHARPQAPIERKMVATPLSTSHGDGSDTKKPVKKTAEEKVGRNDPCPCGSGKKYKNCCMNKSGV
ncbi:MAG: preprotein translocase subunit SecA [Clostridia bacterium]|nr:preprotein translocase subunit SecA [Clostridia bacterium]